VREKHRWLAENKRLKAQTNIQLAIFFSHNKPVNVTFSRLFSTEDDLVAVHHLFPGSTDAPPIILMVCSVRQHTMI
jgi:hypothetical protein